MIFSVMMVTFWMTPFISEQTLSWMMDEFIHWQKPYLLLSATCDEILSWVIKIWMINQLVSHCNIVIQYSPKTFSRNGK
jgi:hypothetical protein